MNMAQVMQLKVRQASSCRNFGKGVGHGVRIKGTAINMTKNEIIPPETLPQHQSLDFLIDSMLA